VLVSRKSVRPPKLVMVALPAVLVFWKTVVTPE
jgi:hypothetical protein